MKKHSQRAQRVGDQIQRELADLLRNEVKDPRVGPVTVTAVDVTADLSHATVHFTHLAGKEHAAETRRGAAAHGGLPAQRAVAPARSLLGAATALRLRRLDRDRGMRLSQLIDDAVAADKKLRSAESMTAQRRAPRAARGASTACCCSTSRRALVERRAAARASALYNAEKAGHTGTLDPLASGLLPLCFGEATKFAQFLLDADKRYTRDRALRRHDRRRGMPKATSSRRGRSRSTATALEAALRARSRGADRRCRRRIRRSSTQGRSLLRLRARGHRRSRAPRAKSDPSRSTLVDWNPPDAIARRRVQQGHVHPRAGRGPRRGARLRRASRRRCAGRRPAASASPTR